jgi:hypothetical protein
VTEVQIEGAAKLHAVANELKELGDGKLRRELTKAIREATKPMKDAVHESFMSKLPMRGGLNQLVARARITNAVKNGSKSAGVTIRAENANASLKAIDAGSVRHRVYGRGPWVEQKLTPGSFTDPVTEHTPAVQAAVIKALDEMASKIHG